MKLTGSSNWTMLDENFEVIQNFNTFDKEHHDQIYPPSKITTIYSIRTTTKQNQRRICCSAEVFNWEILTQKGQKSRILLQIPRNGLMIHWYSKLQHSTKFIVL